MNPGQAASVSVTMKNIGTATWVPTGANPYRLGSQNPQDNTNWGLGRVNLTNSVPPGSQYTFSFTVTAPSTPGTYNFQWRMVQELVQWFGDYTPNVVVNVVDFNVSASPSSLTLSQGSSATSTLTLASLGGFAGTVTLTASVSPLVKKGPTTILSPTSVTLASGVSGTSVLTLSTVKNTPTGTYVITVTGTSGSLKHAVSITLIVT
jgi:hypothetical protein